MTLIRCTILDRASWRAATAALGCFIACVVSPVATVAQVYSFDRQWSTPFPIGVAFERDNALLVVDADFKLIRRFDRYGTPLAQWGSDQHFGTPIGIAVDDSGSIYVGDGNLRKVFVFRPDGTLARTIDGPFYNPSALAWHDGSLYVADAFRIQKFDREGVFLGTWGTHGQAGAGQFMTIGGLCVDDMGHVYATDALSNRVQKFDASGTFITQWGTRGALRGSFKRRLASPSMATATCSSWIGTICAFRSSRAPAHSLPHGAGMKVRAKANSCGPSILRWITTAMSTSRMHFESKCSGLMARCRVHVLHGDL